MIALIPTVNGQVGRAVMSCFDCEQVIIEQDTYLAGSNAVRNILTKKAPEGSIVRNVDDDDIAMSSIQIEQELLNQGVDILVFSFISTQIRETVPEDPLEALIDSVGPWNWAARREVLIQCPWNENIRLNTGTWQFMAMMDAGFKIGFAPWIWGYHWLPRDKSPKVDMMLFQNLKKRVAGKPHLINRLRGRMQRAGLRYD